MSTQAVVILLWMSVYLIQSNVLFIWFSLSSYNLKRDPQKIQQQNMQNSPTVYAIVFLLLYHDKLIFEQNWIYNTIHLVLLAQV